MKLGIITPALTLLPRAHARWEATADLDDIVEVVQTAERLGYHHVTCSEHVAVPSDAAAIRGARYWDPLATFGYLAAVTSSIRFATHVLVLGYHHPLAIAKRYGTLDVVCRGRLVLGVGVGSLAEEFELLDAPFADRGERADDAVRAIRAAWGRAEPAYAGPVYAFKDFVVDPCAPRADVPIWVGGRTRRSLRRAVSLADGWAPFAVTPAESRRWLDAVDVPSAFEVVLQPERALDPAADPDGTTGAIDDLRAAGATAVNLRLVSHSMSHYCEQLAAMIETGAP
ncbi:MAG: putative F420-dependent oxidoreductase [Acidimicrobiales bacterium]|jgi:probable F420-dependent oxidoreductase|nr:putative F420-dependent oxidoreductase [Acidimicrobiales bacterium]